MGFAYWLEARRNHILWHAADYALVWAWRLAVFALLRRIASF